MDSFLDIDKNDSFCKKIFDKLDAFGNKNILQGNDFKENIELVSSRINLSQKGLTLTRYKRIE